MTWAGNAAWEAPLHYHHFNQPPVTRTTCVVNALLWGLLKTKMVWSQKRFNPQPVSHKGLLIKYIWVKTMDRFFITCSFYVFLPDYLTCCFLSGSICWKKSIDLVRIWLFGMKITFFFAFFAEFSWAQATLQESLLFSTSLKLPLIGATGEMLPASCVKAINICIN